ncbi:hypothetical protein K474DRAFT_1669813 [Panus rudis PR-1116 ss-1]|nr:hypothetical protein K474DRAFT_1669813 [Panus rudis PR-1116 ss-1]
MTEQPEQPLHTVFKRALSNASKAESLPTVEDETQELIRSVVDDLLLLKARITELHLFSPNETLGDIATKDLVYLFVPYVLAQISNRMRITDREERIDHIQRVLSYFQGYDLTLENYDIVPNDEKGLYAKHASSVRDPAKKRELKIQQFKKEKELKSRIQALRKKRRQQPTEAETSSDYDLIASLLPSQSEENASTQEDDSETEEITREIILVVLRLLYGQTHGEIDSLQQELELLKNAPPEPPQPPANDPRIAEKKEQDEMWRLDKPLPSGGPDGKGPLLDPQGRPLRPFTILPSNAADRARLQAQVFQPDHRLPTMTIDEYLEIERQRGNVITGGGPQSEQKLTTSEQLQLDSEMDGTIFGEEKAEEKRQKDEKWAQYTDTHPKGAGNRMNRG